ncbi:MAG TPA: FAD-linked oxidase C-terminal domain-containing protein [bacterium]
MNDLQAELKKHVQGAVRFDKVTRQLYSTDASMYQIDPIGVVFPKHEDDLQAVVEVAAKHNVPVLPRGGGTALAGQSVGHAIVMDLSTHMNQILEVNREEGWAVVQPGVVQDQLNRHLAASGWGFGPDTSTSNRATIGGMTGNNSCGSRSIVYGKTIDHIQSIDALLSDGTPVTFGPLDDAGLAAKQKAPGLEGSIYRNILRIADAHRTDIMERYPKILRRVSGYNLDEIIKDPHPNFAKMLVGSEGTLAVFRKMRVKIIQLPKMKAVLVAQFEDMIKAVESDGLILTHKPSAMELVDNTIIEQAMGSPVFKGKTDWLVGKPGAIVIVEFYGDSRQELSDRLDKLEADLKRNKMGYAHVKALETPLQTEIWNLRKGGLGLMAGTRSEAKPLPFVEDTAVDPVKLPGYLKAFDQIVKKHGTTAGYYGHASVGCLHIRPFIDLKKPGEKEKLMGIFNDIADLVHEYGGTIAGEHGDGLARSWLIEKLFGSKIYGAFKDVKAVYDPKNIMNPGKITNAQGPMENLRYGIVPKEKPLELQLDFSRDGGFNFAIEMCNGNGQCRKLDAGTMCPSYQATKSDLHSTRGRANALRAFIQGKFSQEDLTSHEMHEVMDLCLECKACKTECPSKVDMAKMKYEWLYHYQKANGVPLRSKLFGNIELINKIGSAFAPISNLMMGLPLNKMAQGWLGIAPKRTLPPFAGQRFSTWFGKRQSRVSADAPPVVLFHDTFMEYNTPDLGKSAVEILERAGYRVVLVDKKCCGRPIISKGLLDQGRANATHNIEQLKPYAKQGVPIIGVEPSCILTLKEDYRDLVPGPDADVVASQVRTIDEFLAELTKQGKLPYAPANGHAREYLLHGHCHQKSLVGTAPTLAVLRGIPGAKVSEIDSGCCGMAGGFGYEKEHYEVSIAIGEQRLFPAVRKAGPDVTLVADGISCRQQIGHGTDRQAKHLVEVVAEALRA